nr:hypothetical protein [uncultured Psychrobacter sp.]
MSIIKIQINHTENIPKEKLAFHLYDEIGEEYDISEDDIEDYFNIDYVLQLPNDSFVTIFTLDFPTLAVRDIELKDVLKSYLNTLRDLEEVENVVKLQDEILQEIALEYYKSLFSIEMELRNVLTYILTYDEKPIVSDTFKDFGIDKAQTFTGSDILDRHENGLFYILFNHYGSFTEPKNLKAEKIAELLQDVSISDYTEFKNRIQSRYISCDRHSQFLYSIKQKLDPLEKMRNAVMHIRNLSDSLITNFENAIDDGHQGKGVSTLINDFWQSEALCLNESTWRSLAVKELSKFNTDEILRDDQNNFDDREDVIDYIVDEINSKVDISDFEPSDDDFDELRNLLNSESSDVPSSSQHEN